MCGSCSLVRFRASDVLTIVPIQYSSVYIIRLPKRAEKKSRMLFLCGVDKSEPLSLFDDEIMIFVLSFLCAKYSKEWGPLGLLGHIGPVLKSFKCGTQFKAFNVFDSKHSVLHQHSKINSNHKSNGSFQPISGTQKTTSNVC